MSANPMQLVGRPRLARPLPKALPRNAVEALLESIAQDLESKRRTDWGERDLALILTALLAGLRADELRNADVGDLRTTDDGSRGDPRQRQRRQGSQRGRSRPNCYQSSRRIWTAGRTGSPAQPSARQRSRALPCHGGPLGPYSSMRSPSPPVGQYSRASSERSNAPGPTQAVPGALVHGLRHTYATELDGSDVSVYTLMKLLGHESMATSQRYVTAAGTETRDAAARNPIYSLLPVYAHSKD
jgi:integrase/recombinase XerC